MHNLSIAYQLVLSDRHHTLHDTGLVSCHSFTKQFAQLMYNMGLWISAFAPAAVTSIAGSSITQVKNSSNQFLMGLRTDASTTTSTYGIQVGTGTTAESINDTALNTQIAHGTSVGQLQYGAMSYGAPSTTATTTTFRFTRVFTNGSGGTITVQEIGLASVAETVTTNRFLLLRDLTGAVAVTDGQQLTVNYDFTTTI